MFTVGWNAAVCVAALCSLLGMGVCKMNRENKYVLLEEGNVEHATPGKETDKLTAEVQSILSQTDRYQSL